MAGRRGRQAVAAAAAIGATAALTGIGSASSAAAQPAHPAVRSAAPAAVVVATIKKTSISFSSGPTMPAGRTIFNVTSTIKHGDHTLQIIRLHRGYSLSKFESDIAAGPGAQGKADTQAMARLDKRVTWLGGATSRHGSTRQFGVALSPGTYYAFDQDGNAHIKFKAVGPTAHRAKFPRNATATGTANDTWQVPKVLPANGWIRLKNTSTEAHFFALTEVKKSTTKAQVRKYVKNPGGNPAFVLKAHTDSGVFSRHTNVALHIQEPKGKYLLACFWPSVTSGMPHFFMGMWKLVHLK